jgi:hypothetical protein
MMATTFHQAHAPEQPAGEDQHNSSTDTIDLDMTPSVSNDGDSHMAMETTTTTKHEPQSHNSQHQAIHSSQHHPSALPSHHQPIRSSSQHLPLPRATVSKKTKFATHFISPSASSSSSHALLQAPPAKYPRQQILLDGTTREHRGLDEDSDGEQQASEIDCTPTTAAHRQHLLAEDPELEQLDSQQHDRSTLLRGHPHHPASHMLPLAAYVPNDQIRLNVGGMLFQTTIQTLLSEPHSYFCSRFSGRYQEAPSAFDASYFIDRDGSHFRHILNWLRDGVLHVTDEDTLHQIARESEYYQLHRLLTLVKDKLSDINLARIKFDNAPPPSASAPVAVLPGSTHSALPPLPHGGFMQSLVHGFGVGRAGERRYMRDLTKQWGHGGMAGAGTTTVDHATGGPAAASSTMAPFMPRRTHSCPSQLPPSAAAGSPLNASANVFSNVMQHHLPTNPHTPERHHSAHGAEHDEMQNDDPTAQQQTSTEQQQPFVFSLQEDF